MEADKASLGVALRDAVPWPELRGLAETAEQTGYEALFVPEVAGREAFATLAGLAGHTDRLALGTGVLPIGSREPRVAAMGAASVHELSGGRMVLGLGAGPQGRVAELRAYVGEVRRLLDGALGSDGRRLWLAPQAAPIWISALGPRMAELAGEVADGVLLNWCTPERVASARLEVARGAERAGRDPSSVRIAVYVRACLSHDPAHALEALGAAAAEYASMPAYARQLDALGLGEEARAAARSGLAAEGLVRSLCLVGTPGEAARRASAYREAGAGLVVVYPVAAMEPVSSIMGTILAMAPAPALEH